MPEPTYEITHDHISPTPDLMTEAEIRAYIAEFERYELFSRISDATAFDAGEEFETEEQVREYFSPAAQRFMFGEDAVTDEAQLSEWADTVIEYRWHCAF